MTVINHFSGVSGGTPTDMHQPAPTPASTRMALGWYGGKPAALLTAERLVKTATNNRVSVAASTIKHSATGLLAKMTCRLAGSIGKKAYEHSRQNVGDAVRRNLLGDLMSLHDHPSMSGVGATQFAQRLIRSNIGSERALPLASLDTASLQKLNDVLCSEPPDLEAMAKIGAKRLASLAFTPPILKRILTSSCPMHTYREVVQKGIEQTALGRLRSIRDEVAMELAARTSKS